jgi:hypothetical protein
VFTAEYRLNLLLTFSLQRVLQCFETLKFVVYA